MDAGHISSTSRGGVVVGSNGNNGIAGGGDVGSFAVCDDAVELRSFVGGEGELYARREAEKPGWEFLQHFGIHGFDFTGGGAILGDDDGIPSFFVKELYPGDVELDEGGASPLASLEKNNPDGDARKTHFFEYAKQVALGVGEAEMYVFASFLVFDLVEGVGEEREVVTATDDYKLADDFFAEFVIGSAKGFDAEVMDGFGLN